MGVPAVPLAFQLLVNSEKQWRLVQVFGSLLPHTGGMKEVPGSWIQTGSALASAALWGVELAGGGSVCFSVFGSPRPLQLSTFKQILRETPPHVSQGGIWLGAALSLLSLACSSLQFSPLIGCKFVTQEWVLDMLRCFSWLHVLDAVTRGIICNSRLRSLSLSSLPLVPSRLIFFFFLSCLVQMVFVG